MWVFVIWLWLMLFDELILVFDLELCYEVLKVM